MNIFVRNLLFRVKENDLRKVFKGLGSVVSVAIAMDEKGKKSKGFGFVEMPDERQAQDAITALDGKDFMGRVINVSPALSKSEIEEDRDKREISRLELENKVQNYSGEDKEQRDFRAHRLSRYKKGRRSRSFMARQAASGIEEPAMPRKKSQENPMRWHKRSKTKEDFSPGKQSEQKPVVWDKAKGGFRPERKSEERFKPRKKIKSEVNSWSRKNDRPRQSRFKSRKKTK